MGVIRLLYRLGVFLVSGCPVPSPPLRGIGGDLAAELRDTGGLFRDPPAPNSCLSPVVGTIYSSDPCTRYQDRLSIEAKKTKKKKKIPTGNPNNWNNKARGGKTQRSPKNLLGVG